jgi:hypothetical protein
MASPQDFGFRKPIIPVLPCLPIQILLKCKDSVSMKAFEACRKRAILLENGDKNLCKS